MNQNACITCWKSSKHQSKLKSADQVTCGSLKMSQVQLGRLLITLLKSTTSITEMKLFRTKEATSTIDPRPGPTETKLFEDERSNLHQRPQDQDQQVGKKSTGQDPEKPGTKDKSSLVKTAQRKML